MQSGGKNELTVGEAVYNCLGLGACGALIFGSVTAIALNGLFGTPCGLVVCIPGALLGAAVGVPVALAVGRRIGLSLAVIVGLLCGGGLAWWISDFLSQLGGLHG
jgi:hypothetical protein